MEQNPKQLVCAEIETAAQKLVKEIAKSKHEDIESAELREMERKLQLKGYSVNTIKSYKNAFSLFLDYYFPKPMKNITKREIEDYLLFLAKERSTVKRLSIRW